MDPYIDAWIRAHEKAMHAMIIAEQTLVIASRHAKQPESFRLAIPSDLNDMVIVWIKSIREDKYAWEPVNKWNIDKLKEYMADQRLYVEDHGAQP